MMVKMSLISAFPHSVLSTVAAKLEGSEEEGQHFSFSAFGPALPLSAFQCFSVCPALFPLLSSAVHFSVSGYFITAAPQMIMSDRSQSKLIIMVKMPLISATSVDVRFQDFSFSAFQFFLRVVSWLKDPDARLK
jgi:hypothetical protein